MSIEKLNIGEKTSNQGLTDSGRLSATEFNSLTAKINELVVNANAAGVADNLNPKIVDARLRLGVTWNNYQFRIHGTGIETTDEVRLYRNVRGVSKWVPDDEGNAGKKTVKGWHELKFVSDRDGGMCLISPYLTEASDLAGPLGTNPRTNEVEVHVRVPGFVPTWGNIAGDYEDDYDDDLNYFFADFFLAVHPDTKYLNIRHGQRCKSIGITGDEVYKSMARSVEWAIRIFRDGKPITDFLPWKWLVETMPDIPAPMDIRSALEGGDLKLSAVSASHQMSASGGSSTGFPVDGVLTDGPTLTRGTDDVKIGFDCYEFESKESWNASATISAADSQKAGVMSTTMYDLLLKAFATAIQTKYQGQNVVVLSYNPSLYTDSTADFNGQTYTLTDSLCVFDLGTKKTINNSTANERKFIKAITDVWYLPDGITSYASAFNSGSSNYNPFRVHVKIDLSQCTDISSMFCNQLGLTSLDVSDWDVSKIQSFRYAIALTSVNKLDVSKWDVSNCPTLRSIWSSSPVSDPIDTSNWVTTNCTDFGCLFQSINAKNIDVSSFNTSKATAMDFMFAGSSSDRVITGLTNFDTSKVTTFKNMFYGLSNVTLDLSSFSLESATNVDNMFCFFQGTQVVTLGPNFFNAPKITSIDLTDISTSTELKQSLINCYDRKTAGQVTLTLMLSTSMKNALTDAEKTAITAKGYTIK